MEVFNKSSLAEAAISLTCLFVTAIGHKENISLLQQVADKSFITPTAFGQYLNDIYNNTVEELQNSKAQLIDNITKQLQVNYEKQILNFVDKLKATEEINLKQSEFYKQQIESSTGQYQNQLLERQKLNDEKIKVSQARITALEQRESQANASRLIYWVIVIAAIIVGVLIGRGCN
jgi:exonuclease VII large subunit